MAMLELYLIRHGVAEERGKDWPDDSKRPLTAEGVARLQKAARGLNAIDVTFDQIVTSPLVRTRQTATLLADGLANKATVKNLEALEPGHSPRSVMNELSKSAKRHRIALVGHEPGLGELASHLLGAGRSLPFKKGGVAYITVQGLTSRRPGELVWLLPPKVLRRLAR